MGSAEINTVATTLLHVEYPRQAQDLSRLRKLNTYRRLTGSTHSEIAAKINKYVASHSSVSNVIPCSNLDAASVVALASKLKPYIDESLASAFPEDDGRQVYLNLDKVDEKQIGSSAYRNALCAEVVKLWAHHVSKASKETPQLPVFQYVIPSLPVLAPEFNRTSVSEELYHANKSITCIAGHSAAEIDGSDTNVTNATLDWPNWPSTFHWKGTGFGPYPFWQFGFSDAGLVDGWVVNESFADGVYDGADLEVWHSTRLQATKFYHALCRWEWLGFKKLGHQPCVAYQLNTYGLNGMWYLATADAKTRAPDDKFCCNATCTGPPTLGLGTINRKFVENMKFFGEQDYNGRYFSGRSKLYILSMIYGNNTLCPECQFAPALPIDVWYETTLDGRPLRFGELGQDIKVDGYLRDTDLPLIYEEMDITTLDSDPIDESVFKIPITCFTNGHTCSPGRDTRENWGQDLVDNTH